MAFNVNQIKIDGQEEFKQALIEPTPPTELNIEPTPTGSVLSVGDFQSPNFKTGQTGWRIRSDGSAQFNSGIAVANIDIPDTSTTNSMHVESDGDTFWGATPANFTSNNDNASAYILKTGVAKFQSVTVTGATTSRIQVPVSAPFTCSEDVTAGNAVCMGDGTQYSLASNTTDSVGNTIRNTAWWSQSFTTSSGAKSIHSFTIKYNLNLSDPNTVTVNLQTDNAGKPSGTTLTGSTITSQVTTGNGNVTTTYTFSSPVTVSASTVYHMVMQGEDSDNNTTIRYSNNAGTGTNTSADSGATWSANNGPLVYEIFEIDSVSGQVCKTSGTKSRARANNFTGFAISTVTSGNSVDVSITGIENTLSGLTPGTTYFIADAYGALSSTAGTLSRKIGLALSATQLLVKQDNI